MNQVKRYYLTYQDEARLPYETIQKSDLWYTCKASNEAAEPISNGLLDYVAFKFVKTSGITTYPIIRRKHSFLQSNNLKRLTKDTKNDL